MYKNSKPSRFAWEEKVSAVEKKGWEKGKRVLRLKFILRESVKKFIKEHENGQVLQAYNYFYTLSLNVLV